MASSFPLDESDVALLKDGGDSSDDLGGLNTEQPERQREHVPGNLPDASSELRKTDQQSRMDSQLTEHKQPSESAIDCTTATSGLDSVTPAPVGTDIAAPMITSPQAPTIQPQSGATVETNPAAIKLVVEDASEQTEVTMPEPRLVPSFPTPPTPTTPTSERNLSAFPTSPMSPFSDTSSATFAYISGGEESDAELLAAYRRQPEKHAEANVIPILSADGPSGESDPPAEADRVQAPLLSTSKPTLRRRRKMILLGGLMVALAAAAALTAGLVVRSRSTAATSASSSSGSSGSSSDRQPVQPVAAAGNGSFGGLEGDNGPIVPVSVASRVQTTTATTRTTTVATTTRTTTTTTRTRTTTTTAPPPPPSTTTSRGSAPPPPPPSQPSGPFMVAYSCVEPGMVALTFDDGPFRYTPALLDLLDQLGVRATFFVNGNNQGNINDPVYSSMVQRAYSSGHCIGSHTWSHPNLLTLSDDEVRSQLTQVDQAMQRILGVRPNFVRPPYGAFDGRISNIVSGLGFGAIVIWNEDTGDWGHPNDVAASVSVIQNAVRNRNPGSGNILPLMHDVVPTVTDTVRQAVSVIRAAGGWRFVTMDQCLRRACYRG